MNVFLIIAKLLPLIYDWVSTIIRIIKENTPDPPSPGVTKPTALAHDIARAYIKKHQNLCNNGGLHG